jgi:hypothetical protein
MNIHFLLTSSQNCGKWHLNSPRFSVRLFASPSAICNKSAASGRISMKFDIDVFFEKPFRILKLYSNIRKTKGTLYEDQYTYLVATVSLLLRMSKFSELSVQKLKTHISRSINIFQIIEIFMRLCTIMFYEQICHR